MDKPFKPLVPPAEKKTRRLKWIMLALIIGIVGLVIALKTLSRKATPPPAPETQQTIPKVSLNQIVPPARPAAPPAPTAAPMGLPASPTPPPTAQTTTPSPVPPTSPSASPTPPAPMPLPADTAAAASAQPTPSPAAEAGLADSQTDPQAIGLIEHALNLRDVGKLIPARDLFNQALGLSLSPQVRAGVRSQLAKLADQWLFSSKVLEGDTLTAYYVVQPGESLTRIAKKHNVPYEILQRINKINRPQSLQAGQKIKVINGPFHAVVNKTAFTMDLYLQSMYVKTYRVGLGKPEHTTPTGRWLVAPGGKMIMPTWTDPDTGRTYKATDPDYPLGSRWIGLQGIEGDAKGRTGFAIHGTKEPETIGTQSSRGCIRLFNGDVIEVYELLEPGQSYVQVVN